MRFTDYLVVQGIETQIEPEDEGGFSIWVLDDDKKGRAAELLAQFRANPNGAEFQKAGSKAREKREREEKQEASRRSTVADTARVGYERHFRGSAYLPIALIVICIAVAVFTRFGANDRTAARFKISEYGYDRASGLAVDIESGVISAGKGFLPEVRKGQAWRLVTPIFLHFDALHLIFNVVMLYQLGSFLQNRFDSQYLGAMILVIAVLSNFAQALWGSPQFGGMSGVNYGLFGFLWIRGKFDRFAAWQLDQQTVLIMLGWFFLCLFGLIGNVANTVHAVGLGTGMAWGFISSGRLRFSR